MARDARQRLNDLAYRFAHALALETLVIILAVCIWVMSGLTGGVGRRCSSLSEAKLETISNKDLMDYKNLIKALDVPAGYVAPAELRYDDIVARALSRADLVADVNGINASLDLIRRTRGGAWPSAPVSEEFNYVDLVWHECELRENYSFSYAVYDARGQYLGCSYLYPMGRRTPLDDQLLHHDVDVSWWVTPDAYRAGYYTKLYRALRLWSGSAFPFSNPYFSNREIP